MTSDPSSLLLYPFEKEQLSYPDPSSKSMFWNAQYMPAMQDIQEFDCLQAFKPYADVFGAQNIKNSTKFSDDILYDNIFCVLPKQKEAAKYMLARSLEGLQEGGLLMAVAANDAGGKKIESWMKALGVAPISLSKSKCRIVWAYKKEADAQTIALYIQQGAPQKIDIAGQGFVTQPGIFGWNKIDKGSQLLLEHLPQKLLGKGADFGCGYGYLSFELLKKYQNIQKLYALEADYNALSCAQENLKIYEADIDIEYGWMDLTKRQNSLLNLNWIVMNPPFHEGKKMNSDVGQNFIIQAAASLKKRGVLYMVANSHLPYEKLLEKSFSVVTKICEEQGYKVFMAQK